MPSVEERLSKLEKALKPFKEREDNIMYCEQRILKCIKDKIMLGTHHLLRNNNTDKYDSMVNKFDVEHNMKGIDCILEMEMKYLAQAMGKP